MAKKDEIKLKSVAATNSLDNEQDEFATENSTDISVLQNIVSRMGNQGFSGKFQDNIFILSYTTYITGLAINEKNKLEVDLQNAKKVIEDKYEEKTDKKIKLKEVGEEFNSEPYYTSFKQTLIQYSKFYEYKKKDE